MENEEKIKKTALNRLENERAHAHTHTQIRAGRAALVELQLELISGMATTTAATATVVATATESTVGILASPKEIKFFYSFCVFGPNAVFGMGKKRTYTHPRVRQSIRVQISVRCGGLGVPQ